MMASSSKEDNANPSGSKMRKKDKGYDYTPDVESFLKDQRTSIDELQRQHEINLATSGQQIRQRMMPFVKDDGPYATPTLGKDGQTSIKTATTNSDWSKVVEKESKAKKRKNKLKKGKSKNSTFDRSKSKSVSTTKTASKVKDAKKKEHGVQSAIKKSPFANNSGLSPLGSLPKSKQKNTHSYLPKKTQDEQVLDILEDVLGLSDQMRGGDTLRHELETSGYFKTSQQRSPDGPTKVQAPNETEDKPNNERTDNSTILTDPALRRGVAGQMDSSRAQKNEAESGESVISKLDALVRKLDQGKESQDLEVDLDKKQPPKPTLGSPGAAAGSTTTEERALDGEEGGINTLKYETMECEGVDPSIRPPMSSLLEEVFSYETALLVPSMKYSRTLYRPMAEPYGMDPATGPAYEEEPPSTIDHGGPAPPLEARRVRPIVDNSPQIQEPINHEISTPWEEVLADRRAIPLPCKRTTILLNDFVPADVDLGLDRVETIEKATVELPTQPEPIEEEPEAEEAPQGSDDEYDPEKAEDQIVQMKRNAEVPQLDQEALNQENMVDLTDNPPKGLVKELTEAIVNQLKSEGLLAGSSEDSALRARQQEMVQQQLSHAEQAMQAAAAAAAHAADAHLNIALHPQAMPEPQRIRLGDRRVYSRQTHMGSALLTARISAMSHNNQAPLRGIKTATMDPYRPPERQVQQANLWAKASVGMGGASPLAPPQAQAPAPAFAALSPAAARRSSVVSVANAPVSGISGNDGLVEPISEGQSAVAPTDIVVGGAAKTDYTLDHEEENDERKLSDEEPALTTEQQKDLFTKCLNNRSKQVEELFALGVPVDTADEHGNTCLHVACQSGSKRMIKGCLRWGAEINKQNKQGQTPLHYCFAYKYEDLAAYLVSKGADDSIVNNFGLTCYDGLKPEDEEDNSNA